MRLRSIVLLLSTVRIAIAHDPGLSSALVTVGETEAVVQGAFAPGEIQRLPNPEPSILVDHVMAWQLERDPVAICRVIHGRLSPRIKAR